MDHHDAALSSPPDLQHALKHDDSVLSIAVSDQYIFTGTHDGEIVVWSLGSYELVARIQAHKRSVLSLFLSGPTYAPPEVNGNGKGNGVGHGDAETLPSSRNNHGQGILFSSAADAVVSGWCPRTFRRLYEIYGSYDVGDIFSVAYSSLYDTLYMGAQNATIQWVTLSDETAKAPPDSARHPERRNHRFFDSKNLGGTSTPRRNDERWALIPKAETVLEMHEGSVRQFAHFGYIYCMIMAKGPTVLVDADEDVLISGSGDGTIKLWTLGGGSGSDTSDGDDGDAAGADKGGLSELMVLGSDDGDSVLCLAVDGGSFLYAGKLDGAIELWDLDTRQRLRVVKAHEGDVMCLDYAWGCLWSASSNGNASKHSTAGYNEEAPGGVSTTGGGSSSFTPAVSQKYQCLAHWPAHRGAKILASATTTTAQGDRLYITGANDNDVLVWRVNDVKTRASSDAGVLFESGDAEATHNDMIFASLREFVSYKTISSRPEFAEDCRRGARFLGALFKKLGAQVEMLFSTSAAGKERDSGDDATAMHNPVVYAHFSGKGTPAADRRRILFYGHYDVVPADTKKGNKWATDPFSLRGINGYLYGRGVSDNKGPIMAALYAVTDLVAAHRLDSDVVFLIEGEEESGSRGFRETVQQHRALLGRIDYILLANSYWLDDDVPCLTYGLRGVLHATVCVDSQRPDSHSGVDGSRLRDEPLSDLTAVLGRVKGRGNRVMLPGFYDGIPDVTPEEEARYDDIAATLLAGSSSSGGSGGVGADDRRDLATRAVELKASLKARWREPNLTLHRYKVSGAPEGSLVSSHASARISIRLVPGQEVGEVAAALESFLHAEFEALESVNRLNVRVDQAAEPWLGEPGNAIFRTLECAVVKAWGGEDDGEEGEKVVSEEKSTEGGTQHQGTLALKPHRKKMPLYIREGGSIPSIRFLEKEFGAPAAHLPCGQASDAAHLDNERLRVVNLVKSREIFREVFGRL